MIDLNYADLEMKMIGAHETSVGIPVTGREDPWVVTHQGAHIF
jgi:hypothetical protein